MEVSVSVWSPGGHVYREYIYMAADDVGQQPHYAGVYMYSPYMHTHTHKHTHTSTHTIPIVCACVYVCVCVCVCLSVCLSVCVRACVRVYVYIRKHLHHAGRRSIQRILTSLNS